MRLRSLGGVLRRPWSLLAVGVLLTCVAVVAVGSQAPTRYQSMTRLMLLLPPNASRLPSNPFLNQPNGLVVLASVVEQSAHDDGTLSMIAAEGLRVSFETGGEPSSPTITISVQGPDPDEVVQARDVIVAGMRRELRLLQAEVDAPSRQQAHVLAMMEESRPYRIGGDRLRGMLGLIAAGVLVSALLAARVAGGAVRPRPPSRAEVAT